MSISNWFQAFLTTNLGHNGKLSSKSNKTQICLLFAVISISVIFEIYLACSNLDGITSSFDLQISQIMNEHTAQPSLNYNSCAVTDKL